MKGTYGANKPSIMAWREEHKEQYLEYMRNYNETNKLRIREQMKQKYDENGKQKKREYYLKKKAIKLEASAIKLTT